MLDAGRTVAMGSVGSGLRRGVGYKVGFDEFPEPVVVIDGGAALWLELKLDSIAEGRAS
jgi:hypothetical protein